VVKRTLGLALIATLSAAAAAATEPVTLACRDEATPEAPPFFVQLDFDEKSVRLHGLGYPAFTILLVRPWIVHFAERPADPAHIGSIHRVTGELRLDPVGEGRSPLRATCVRGTRIF
jgi:hypothetical protein